MASQVTSTSTSSSLRPLDASLLRITESASNATLPPSNTLVFGQTFTPHMLTVKWTATQGWDAPEIKPYGPLMLDPSSTVLHYAPTLFEGMKAYKDKNGVSRLFRPEKNMERMNRGCARLGFPTFQGEVLIELIKKLVALDDAWIPTDEGCSLYIRPTCIGTRASLGVAPSDEILLFVICSPVGPYYATGRKPVSLLASTQDVRACSGGIGSYKFGANYAGGVVPQMNAAKLGYQQILWLYGPARELTEVGMMNLFVVLRLRDGDIELATPPLADLILPGVTRDSILCLARAHADPSNPFRIEGLPDFVVSERQLFMSDLITGSKDNTLVECFGSGTAAVISSVERIGFDGEDISVPCELGSSGRFAAAFLRELEGRQQGSIESEWSVVVE